MALDDGWMKDAACRGLSQDQLDWFFPEPHQGVKPDIRKARAICKTCPVRIPCLFYSVAHSITEGVWGGLSENQRRKLSLELRMKIRLSWFRSHPNSRPMGSMGYFARKPRTPKGGDEYGSVEEVS